MKAAIVLACYALFPAGYAGAAAPEGLFLSSVAVRGNSVVVSTDILAGAELRPGAAWNAELAALDKDVITSLYHSRGFMEAEVSLSELAAGASVFLTIDVREGRRYVFGNTVVTGLKRLRPQTVKKELTYKRGEPYSQEKLLNSQSQLYSAGWFDSLRTRISSSPASAAINVELQAVEKHMLWVKGGVGYGSEEKERVSLGFTEYNFLGRGYKLDVSGMLSRIWLEYRADFSQRHFLDTGTELHDASVWRREHRQGYDLENLKNTVSLGRKLASNLYGAVHYRLQRSQIYRVDPQISQETPSLTRLAAAGLSFNRDTTDDFFYPSRGLRSEATMERAGGIWGGDTNLYKGSLSNTVYHRVFPGVILVGAARWAFVRETDTTPDVPIYERLFTGGANSIRGYSERGVGPVDALGNPLGGKVMLGAGTELRFPLYKKLRMAVFVDGGQVADSLRGAAPGNWKYGAGGGLRYLTPVGPIRTDFGYKLNPDRPAAAERWRVHLSIGEAF